MYLADILPPTIAAYKFFTICTLDRLNQEVAWPLETEPAKSNVFDAKIRFLAASKFEFLVLFPMGTRPSRRTSLLQNVSTDM